MRMCGVSTWAKNSACKKKVRKMFFSEEKNQKTFISPAASPPSGHVPDPSVGTRSKSLLLLFFRKEDSSSAFNRALTTGNRLG